MKSITLEILRDGPPHNQLLSPLTKYLALCGEHAAVSLSLGFEHGQWLARIGGLSYRDSEQTRRLQLSDAASTMGDLLGQIPGFVAELARCRVPLPERTPADALRTQQTVQLRFVLNANELSLLPIELANAPSGFSAAGQLLALQTDVPLCITREVRRATATDVRWDREPRVLFAFADPLADVPYEQHLLALRNAVDPWVKSSDHIDAPTQRTEAARAEVARHLVVLPHASLRAIHDRCSKEAFTHIHLLAHGVPYRRGDDRRFGLALHDGINPAQVDVVDGERLATALRPHLHDRSQSLAEPLVVSIAGCDTGNAGSVVGAGASIAHELHLKGIPLVVASQFPLTVQGSIVMVAALYEGLLWGQDPRCSLDALRRRLRSMLAKNHDWASIVAYAALPRDIEEQSDALALRQVRSSIRTALDSADDMVRRLWTQRSSLKDDSAAIQLPSGMEQRLDKVDYLLGPPLRKLSESARRLKDLLAASTRDLAEMRGLQAATHKRTAELHVTAASLLRNRGWIDHQELGDHYARARDVLRRSKDCYIAAFLASRGDAWALVQTLTLELVLQDSPGPVPEPQRSDTDDARVPPTSALPSSWRERWMLARLLSEQDRSHDDPKRALWALGNLVELHLLATAWPRQLSAPTVGAQQKSHDALILEYARQIRQHQSARPIEVHSIRRQIQRYLGFFPELAEQAFLPLMGPAATVFDLLPAES